MGLLRKRLSSEKTWRWSGLSLSLLFFSGGELLLGCCFAVDMPLSLRRLCRMLDFFTTPLAQCWIVLMSHVSKLWLGFQAAD